LSVIKRFNMYFLTKYVICSVPAQINFCMEVGLMPKKRKCSYCKRELKLVEENRKDHATPGPVVYRCHNLGCKKCSKYVSIRDGTVFQGSHLSVAMVLRLIVLYVNNVTSYEQLRLECVDERDEELSHETVNDWLTYLC